MCAHSSRVHVHALSSWLSHALSGLKLGCPGSCNPGAAACCWEALGTWLMVINLNVLVRTTRRKWVTWVRADPRGGPLGSFRGHVWRHWLGSVLQPGVWNACRVRVLSAISSRVNLCAFSPLARRRQLLCETFKAEANCKSGRRNIVTPFDLKDTHARTLTLRGVPIRALGGLHLPPWVCACARVPAWTHSRESHPAAQGVPVVQRTVWETRQLGPLLSMAGVRSDCAHSCAAGDGWVQSGFSQGGR